MEWDKKLLHLLYTRAAYQHLRYQLNPRQGIVCEDAPYKQRMVPAEVIEEVNKALEARIAELDAEINQYGVKKNEAEAVQGHPPKKEAGSSVTPFGKPRKRAREGGSSG